MFFAKKKNDFYKISAHTQTLTYSFYISVIINMSFDFLSVNVHNVDVMFCKCCVIMFILRQNVISNKNVNVNINVVLNVKVFQSKCVFWIIPFVYNKFLYYLFI